MKSILRIIPALIAAAAVAHSQDEAPEASSAASTTPVAPTTARILGAIPDGTPPPPTAPKPEFRIPEQDILATTTHEQGGRTITIQRIKPIALPPPPPPAELSTVEVDAEFSQRIAEYSEEHPQSGLLFLGATVFRSKDAPPQTLVRYWPDGGGENITFWSSADFALIAGGINSFVDTASHTHHLFMSWDSVDIDHMTDLQAAKGREYDAPEMPEFPADKATFQFIGKQPAAEQVVVIQSLHNLYNSELARLTTAHAGREQARIDREEYLKANPPQPKDVTIHYWRTEKPASKETGRATR